MWHAQDFRKPIALSSPHYTRGRNAASQSSQVSIRSERVPTQTATPTVLGPSTVNTVFVPHTETEEPISILLQSQDIRRLKQEEEDLETAAALLANSSAPTVWVKQQHDVEGESEEKISIMDEPSSLAEFAQTVLGPSTAQTTVVYESGAIDVLTHGLDDSDHVRITPPKHTKQQPLGESEGSSEGSAYEGFDRKAVNSTSRTSSPIRTGPKRRAAEPAENVLL
jgi:hypothetical protein